jgi:hypothetical protein
MVECVVVLMVEPVLFESIDYLCDMGFPEGRPLDGGFAALLVLHGKGRDINRSSSP